MRIVHVCRQFHPAPGGLETVVEQIAHHQRAKGNDVRVVTLNRLFGTPAISLRTREIIDGIEVIRLPFCGSERYPIAWGVLKSIRGFDLVHVHGIDFFFDFLAITRFIHRRQMIVTTHGGFFHTSYAAGLKKLWFKSVTRLSSRAYAAVVACSEDDHRLFEQLDHPCLCLIENGVDTTKFKDLADGRAKQILYFGRLAPNKGIERLIDWFSALRRADPAWRLTIAGRPAGTASEMLRRRADVSGDGNAVTLVESPDALRLKRLISQSSVYASASSYEGFGIAAVEAASAGLIPVLSAIPPFERALQRLGAGLLTSFEPSAEEVTRFERAWSAWDTGKRQTLVEQAVARFGWEKAGEAYLRLCRSLVPTTREIGGVAVWAAGRDEALKHVQRCIEDRRPFMLTFCNAHTVNMAQRSVEMRRCLRSSLVLNDGIGLDLASRWLFGRSFPENLTAPI